MQYDPAADVFAAINRFGDRIYAFLAWVYNWVTVLVGIVAGALYFVPDLLELVGVVDFAAFGISAATAAKITSGVALAKGLIALFQSRRVA